VTLLLVAMFVRLLEPHMAFLPEAGERTTPRDFGIDYEPIAIHTRDGERLHGWALSTGTPRASILYFHGNGGNLSIWAPIVAGIARNGYRLFAFDYRGYGLSTGRPTERGLYEDVRAMVDRFWDTVPSGAPVLYWGRSLGVSMAAYGATVRPPHGLILESGFPDARSLLRGSPLLAFLSWFSSYRFPAVRFLAALHTRMPILVLHGDDDRVVSIVQGRALYDAIRSPKQFVAIRGGDHNDLAPAEPDRYWAAVDAFAGSLALREGSP
jgi:hypothetical protein